jgi:hypothetical protein
MTQTYLHETDLALSLVFGDGSERADGRPCVKCVADQHRVDRDLSRRLGDVILVHVPRCDSRAVDG